MWLYLPGAAREAVVIYASPTGGKRTAQLTYLSRWVAKGSVVSVVFLHPHLGQGTQGLLDGTPSLLSSRIAKSTAGATSTADFEQNGFEVISVTGPDMCSDDHSRVLIGQLLGAFAQYEKAAIVLKLRGATWPVWLGMTFVPGLLCPQR